MQVQPNDRHAGQITTSIICLSIGLDLNISERTSFLRDLENDKLDSKSHHVFSLTLAYLLMILAAGH